MSDAAPNSATGTNDPSFVIQRVYLKDLSLEQPNAPGILLVASEPQIQVELDIAVDRLTDELFEVALVSTVTARVDGKVMFLVEAKQAGIFEFKNIPPEQIDPMLGITCPTIIFPYLRSNVADIISRARILTFMACMRIAWRKPKPRKVLKRVLVTQKARLSCPTNEYHGSWWWSMGYGNRPICSPPSCPLFGLFMGA
jgi:preprotein translocase subunit SecB